MYCGLQRSNPGYAPDILLTTNQLKKTHIHHYILDTTPTTQQLTVVVKLSMAELAIIMTFKMFKIPEKNASSKKTVQWNMNL